MKTGRNERCPCGSGKKYKKCCIQQRECSNTFAPTEPKEQYCGNATERQPGDSPFDIQTESMCCLVTRLNEYDAGTLNHPEQSVSFVNGDYIVTVGDCSNIQLEGPFKSAESAFDIAREKFGAVRFMGKPQFI